MKGFSQLVRALGAVVEGGRELRVTFAGSSSDILNHLPAAVAERALAHRHVDNDAMPALLSTHHLLVDASLWEAGPLRVFEAAAVGLGIVATDVGAVSDKLQHRRSALIVPPGNTPALARAVAEIADDEPLRARLAERARLAANAYRPEACAQQTLAMYRRVAHV
jgi:phenylacetate-CoA ligase